MVKKVNVQQWLPVLLAGICSLSAVCNATAQVSLPAFISDSMVLQRNQPLKIWGWATPGEKVSITFNKQKANTTTDFNGRWKVTLPAMQAGGPYRMQVKGTNEIQLNGILIGDVWLASGQSNMEFPMSRLQQKYPQDIAASASYPIREFHVKERYSAHPEEKTEGAWKPANPVNILRFSAVAYFFARQLYETQHVPIGILHASWPGTPVESWISIDSLRNFPDLVKTARQFSDPEFTDSLLDAENRQIQQWNTTTAMRDSGIAGKWAQQPAGAGWQPIQMPGFWQQQGARDVHGAVWLKHTVQLPESLRGNDVFLELGLIDDMDSTYFNGTFIGTTDNKYNARRYRVPAALLRSGANEITIRVVDFEGNGGIPPGKTYRLTNGTASVSVEGAWLYRVGAAMPGRISPTRVAYKPTFVYNGLIQPILGYPIKGAIWYQGESNASGKERAGKDYRSLLPTMIHEWRDKWQQGDFPFLIVQLANWLQPRPEPSESYWALLRESQYIVSRTVPNCGLAVAVDLGEANDIHPLNKKDVGYRLALQAQRKVYGDTTLQASGPVYQSMQKQGDKIVLRFEPGTGELLVKGGGKLQQFAIAGADRKFVWADAVIEGNQVIVRSSKVPDPVAVRYAWADNPDTANLYNKAGLPAMPFRTDDW
jgi:sialate O-acetylesterase